MTEASILIVKTGEAPAPVKSRHGDFDVWIARELGEPLDRIDVASVYLGASLPDPASIRGVVVTGSPAMVTERPEWSEASARWLADVVREDAVPVLGICYGHQLIAHGLGGEVGPNPNGREMGTVEIAIDFGEPSDTSRARSVSPGYESIFEPGRLPAHMSHVESVLQPPEGARVLARTELDPHSVLEFGPRQWGVQFHPEFDREIMCAYVEARREILLSEGLDPDDMVSEARETPAITRILSRFAHFVG